MPPLIFSTPLSLNVCNSFTGLNSSLVNRNGPPYEFTSPRRDLDTPRRAPGWKGRLFRPGGATCPAGLWSWEDSPQDLRFKETKSQGLARSRTVEQLRNMSLVRKTHLRASLPIPESLCD